MCPVCKSENVSPSKRPRLLDYLMAAFGQRPLRCRDCNSRFYLSSRLEKHIRERRNWVVAARKSADRANP